MGHPLSGQSSSHHLSQRSKMASRRGRPGGKASAGFQVVAGDDAVVRRALKEPVTAIVEAVHRALERTSPELAEDIINKGIYLAGGGALLAGLPERLSLETSIRFFRAADPLTAIVRGTGRVLEHYKEMRSVLIA